VLWITIHISAVLNELSENTDVNATFISRAKRVQKILLHKECLEKGDTIAFWKIVKLIHHSHKVRVITFITLKRRYKEFFRGTDDDVRTGTHDV